MARAPFGNLNTFQSTPRRQASMIMHFPSVLSLLLYATLSSYGAAAPADLEAVIPNNIQYECYKGTAFRPNTRNAAPKNCARALLAALPVGGELGDFHQGGEKDIFYLPRSGAAEDCQVVVDLERSGTPVRGSWTDVYVMANTLSVACAYRKMPGDSGFIATGGKITANGLSVELVKWDGVNVGNASTREDAVSTA